MNSKSFCFLTLVLATLSLGISCSGQSKIEKYLNEIVDQQSFSGSVVIARNGEVLLNKGYGFADYEHSIPNTATSVHRIGSLTKQLTSMAVLYLFGKSDTLNLNDPISKYFAIIPDAWKDVTVFHLLTHTSGIPDYFGDLDAVPVEDTFKEIEKVFSNEANSKLSTEPGEVYQYNNFGYVLLGRIIEQISGKGYATYLHDEIFVRLDMQNTTYDDPRLIINDRSEGYVLTRGIRMNDKLKDPAAYAAGGLLSTTADLFKWSKALKSDVILNQTQRAAMFTPYKNDYALGWQVVKKYGRTMYNHNGSTHGYNARMVYYPDEDIFIAVLGNNEDVRAASITCDIEGLIFDKDNHLLSLVKHLPTKNYQKLTGEYTSKSGTERSIEKTADKLYYVNGESRFELSALADNYFCFSGYGDIRLKFTADSFEISSCSVNPELYYRSNE